MKYSLKAARPLIATSLALALGFAAACGGKDDPKGGDGDGDGDGTGGTVVGDGDGDNTGGSVVGDGDGDGSGGAGTGGSTSTGGMGGNIGGMGGMAGTGLGWDFTDAAEVSDFSIKPEANCSETSNCMDDGTISHADGVMVLSHPWGADSNAAIVETYVDHDFGEGTEVDLSGKTITVNLTWESGGIGSATDATGGFDAYLVLQNGGDDGWVSIQKSVSLDAMATGYSASIDLSSEADTLNPAAVRLLTLRIDSKHWSDGDPVFDYTPAVFHVDSIVIE